MTTEVSIKGLNKAEVLAALYNASKPLGRGFSNYDPTPMTKEEADTILCYVQNFEYLRGRIMKVNLSGNTFDPGLYDRDNGAGAAERALSTIQKVNQ